MTGGGTTWNFTYNADGLRTKRTNGSTTYSYVYNGGSLSQMTVGSNTLYFAYDASGAPLSITYNGTNYYYATNLQGDVTAILNTSGTAVVQYTYDAWGKLLTTTGSMASTLGTHNPLRYRGYVYDTETALYYLQSRYYNPAIGRFINADVLVSTGQGILGNNMFAYCNNNPVNHSDPAGLCALHSANRINNQFSFACMCCCGGGYSYPLESNIADTPENQISGVIYGQSHLPYAGESIGLGTYGNSGCQYIAVYNAMQLIGKPQSLAFVTSEMFWYGAVALGAGGAGPWAACEYFDAHGVDYTGSFSASSLVSGISEGDVIVFTIWNDRTKLSSGWHAITALYTNGKYLVFNQYSNSTSYVSVSSLEQVYSEGVWLYGIRIDR